MNFTLHHAALTVNDITESIAWYKEALGFEATHQYSKHGMDIAQLQCNGVRLELFSFDQLTPLPEYRKSLMDDLHVVGTKHICLEVEDLDESVKQLEAKGVEFATEIDTAGFGGRYVFLKDCNGILIELYQP